MKKPCIFYKYIYKNGHKIVVTRDFTKPDCYYQSISKTLRHRSPFYTWVYTIDGKNLLVKNSKIEKHVISEKEFIKKYNLKKGFWRLYHDFVKESGDLYKRPNITLALAKIYIEKALHNLNLNFDTYYADSKLFVIIHYPKLTITNDFDDKHVIYDLYVKMVFFNTTNKNVSMRLNSGFRTTLRRCEKEASYIHGHLSGNGGDFCLGQFRSFNTQIHYKDLEAFEDLLLNLQTFLEFEDLNNPYRTFYGLYKKMAIKVSKKDIFNTLPKLKVSDFLVVPASGDFNSYKVKVKSEKLINITPNKFKGFKDSFGTWRCLNYDTKELPEEVHEINNYFFPNQKFKNKPVKLRIINNIEMLEKTNYEINPKFLVFIESFIQPVLNNILYEKNQQIQPDRVKRFSNSYNQSRTFCNNYTLPQLSSR